MEEILHQLRLVVFPTIYRVSYIPDGAGFQPSTVCYSFIVCVFFLNIFSGLRTNLDDSIWWAILFCHFNFLVTPNCFNISIFDPVFLFCHVRLRVCILGGTSFLYSESESFVKVGWPGEGVEWMKWDRVGGNRVMRLLELLNLMQETATFMNDLPFSIELWEGEDYSRDDPSMKPPQPSPCMCIWQQTIWFSPVFWLRSDIYYQWRIISNFLIFPFAANLTLFKQNLLFFIIDPHR